MTSADSTDAGRGPRLDAYLSRAGLASRKEARRLVGRGDVCVDGVECGDFCCLFLLMFISSIGGYYWCIFWAIDINRMAQEEHAGK